MTLMLASVTGAEEATIAVRHGADVIDVKDVRLALGSATPALARTVRLRSAGPISPVCRRQRRSRPRWRTRRLSPMPARAM
jgi:hypothetical protein